MPTIERSGSHIYYEDSKEPKPAIVLIRGLARSGRYWGDVGEQLQRHFRTLVVDNRGVGRSSISRQRVTTDLLADDIAAILDHAGVDRAHVFGISLGSMITQKVGLRHPDRVNRLILGCSTAGGISPKRFKPRTIANMVLSGLLGPRRGGPLVAPYLLDPQTVKERPEIIKWWINIDEAEPPPLKGKLAQLIAASRHNTQDSLHAIKAPTLVLVGDGDRVIDPRESFVLARKIPDAKLRVIVGAGHNFTTDKPRESLNAVYDFLGVQSALQGEIA